MSLKIAILCNLRILVKKKKTSNKLRRDSSDCDLLLIAWIITE